jgi:hypothetical protein
MTAQYIWTVTPCGLVLMRWRQPSTCFRKRKKISIVHADYTPTDSSYL